MTREEKEKAIGALEISTPVMVVTQEQHDEYIQILNKIRDWLEQELTTERIEYGTDGNPYVLSMTNGKELEQDPCDTCDYEEGSIYCKEHCPYEAKIEQEPCEDIVSRQAVNTLIDELARAISDERCGISRGRSTATIMRDIRHLPPVIPQQKLGKWIVDLQTATESYYICSECGRRIHLSYPDTISNYPYCHCGARMVKSQESV